MILQALNEYYERKAADPDSGIAPEGFEERTIPYLLVIDLGGDLVDIQFTGDDFQFKKGISFLVPMWQQKSGKDSWKTTNLLWDHYGYVLGHPKSADPKDLDTAQKQQSTFISMVLKVLAKLPGSQEIEAVHLFYENNGPQKVKDHEIWQHIEKITGCNLTFKVVNSLNLVAQIKEIHEIAPLWNGVEFVESFGNSEEVGVCLVSGEVGRSIARLHRPISGVNKKPAPLLAVNNLESPAFSSFNKKQGLNFPISEKATFRYATALNTLLRQNSKQKLRVGDATTVFWSDRQNHLEDDFGALFDEPPKDGPDQLTSKVRALLKSVDTGVLPPEDHDTKFFILGLSPNSARISVRFWHVGTVAEFSRKIASHFHDLEIIHAPHQRDHLSIWWLLRSVAALGKSENIPPNLAGDWIRAILTGSAYPETLFQSAIRRIRAEHGVTYERAGIIKASLNRKARFQTQTDKEMTVSLDKDNTNPGYRIGRLFAVLEKIQEEASPGINATIRDRYYSSASGTPSSVLPILLRIKNHHLGKLEKGREIYFEKLLGEIVGEVAANGFPAQLNLQDQGRFAIGYYHQRQDFFKKSIRSESVEQGE